MIQSFLMSLTFVMEKKLVSIIIKTKMGDGICVFINFSVILNSFLFL